MSAIPMWHDLVCERCGSKNVRGWFPALVAINDPPQLTSIDDLDLDAEPLFNAHGFCGDCKDPRYGCDATVLVTREVFESAKAPSDGDEGGQYGDLR